MLKVIICRTLITNFKQMLPRIARTTGIYLCYILIYLFPVIIEGLMLGFSNNMTTLYFTLIISALCQIGLTIYTGTRICYNCTNEKGKVVLSDGIGYNIFSRNGTADECLDCLIGGSCFLFMLPVWITTNIIGAIYNISDFPMPQHLIVYLPILSWGLSFGLGHLIARCVKKEYLVIE